MPIQNIERNKGISVNKKLNKRQKTKYPGLVQNVNPKTRWEHIDFDYLDKLSDEEKRWLSNFNEEYLSGNFNHPGKRLNKTKEERRQCYNRNNARNRDVISRNRTNGWIGVEKAHDIIETSATHNPGSHEDTIANLIDLKNTPKPSKDSKSLKRKKTGNNRRDDSK